MDMGNGFFRTKVGFEYPLLLLVLSIAIAIRSGRMSLDCKLGVEIQDRIALDAGWTRPPPGSVHSLQAERSRT